MADLIDGPELFPAIGDDVKHPELGRVKLVRRYDSHCNVIGSDGIVRGVPTATITALNENVFPISSLVPTPPNNLISTKLIGEETEETIEKINQLTANQISSIAGISRIFARKIVDNRPSLGYESYSQLVEIARKNAVTSDLSKLQDLDYETRSA